MKRVLYTLSILMFLFITHRAAGQAGVLDPNDPDVIFTSQNQPPAPAWNQISKWGHTNRLNWNPFSYGYKSYYFRGMAFRIKFPKTYQQGVADGKKYPLFLFLHGLGEYAPIYDNELQLVHGGQLHAQKVNDGTFDGFLLYPQSTSGYLNGNMPVILDLLDSLKKYTKLDEDRVVVGGLSSGGQACWDYLEAHPEIYAAATPISAARVFDPSYVASMLSVPVWTANGGKDKGPYPETVTAIVNKYNELGGDIKQSFFPDLGHGVWNNFWAEPGYFQYLNDAHKAQPVVLYHHNEFCPSDPVNAQMILQPGFYQYEWQKDGITISGATSANYTATEYGTYRARFKRKSTSEWSDWSPRPVVVSQKGATVTPPISVNGLHSYVLPAPDGAVTVPLSVPEGYESYEWRRISDNSLVSTANTIDAAIGQYKVKVTEKFGCSSSFSDPFTVVNASGANAPDKASNLTAVTLSNTSIEVYWNQNPNPTYNETAFEIYRSTTAGSNYVLAGIVPADSLLFIDNGLSANVKYYYIVRAINANGASANSNETSETTESDKLPPTTPANLMVTGTTRHSISLKWDESTDDVGVKNYDIYINGGKAYTTTQTSFTVNNLDSFTTYSFYVTARDFSGNISVPSPQASGFTKYSGFDFSVYQGSWTTLPDFSTLTSVYDGHSPNMDITVSPFIEYYGMVWKGYIYIPTTATYTFYIQSDDGSALYVDNHYGAGVTPLILNDGTHGMVTKSATIYLTKGVHKIGATFFQGNGGQGLNVYWQCSAAGFPSQTIIPNQYFGDQDTPAGTSPAMPSNLLADPQAFNKVQLTWQDNSNDETGFEIYRKSAGDAIYQMITLAPSNANAYTDTLVKGSTTYSYKIQAVNTNGASGFNPADLSGVNYNYYEGSWNNLPNFNNLTPKASGTIDNFSLSPMLRADNFAFKFSGVINVPVAGSYTFFTKSDDGSKLYIDNFNSAGQVVNNDYLQGPTERSGTINLTAGKHNIFVTFFEKTGGEFLEVRWQGPGLAKQLIPDFALRNTNTTITTPDAPALPETPVNVSLQVMSATQINLSFESNSPVTGYEVYRSLGDNNHFRLYRALSTSEVSVMISDTSLFPNTIAFYKVRAIGISGYSDFSSIVSDETFNTVPVLKALATQYIYYSGTSVVSIQATDADGDDLAFTFNNLPGFVSFAPSTKGNGNLIFTPSSADLGNHNITVNVDDGHGGTDSKTFQFIVTTNRKPSIGRIRDLTVNEGSTGIINIIAVDLDRRSTLSFQLKGQPNFCTTRPGEEGIYIATFNPGYADAGTYSFWAFVSDGLGGVDSAKVNVNVADVDPGPGYDDGTKPVAPRAFTATPLSNGNVLLQWQDIAYNEQGYSILRSETPNGTYTLLNSGAANANEVSYLDNTTVGNKDYYYKIFAFNSYGNSDEVFTEMVTSLNRTPTLQPISNVYIKSGASTSINLIGSDDVGEALTFETIGLPAFVTLQNVSNGLATLQIHPNVGEEGFYKGIKIKITDPYGAVAVQEFSITVSDNAYRSVYINFGPQGGTPEPAPWNNYLSYPFANLAINDLLDDANTNSGFSFRFLNQLSGTSNTGMYGYGKGIYPDNVLKTSVYTTSNSTMAMKFSGLDPLKKYNIVIMAGLNSGAQDSGTFTSGGQTVLVNGMYNTKKSAQLNGLVPDGSGSITVSFTKTINSEYLNINAIEIQEYSGAPVIRPANLYTYSTLSRDSINLTWSDRSNIETGYEIWRATSPEGSYALVTTVPANTTSYTDKFSLTPGVTYYYKIKAKNGDATSFSNIASASLADNVVLLNLNAESTNNEPLPWNNTDDGPSSEGLVVDNLVNTNFQPTGIDFEITKEFNGKGFAGVSSPGILPYNVMFTNYWTDAAQVSQVKFSNLDQRKKYRVGIFNSVDKYGFYQGNYTINGVTKYINGYKNGSEMLYFEDISPDENGEIYVSVSPDGASPYCFTSAYTVEGYLPTGDGQEQSMMRIVGSKSENLVNPIQITGEKASPLRIDMMEVSAYPNPFVAELNARIQLPENAQNVSIELYDIDSRLIYKKQIANSGSGGSIRNISIPIAKTLSPGTYILQLSANGVNQKTIKLIKGK